jgi:hypothetical protein
MKNMSVEISRAFERGKTEGFRLGELRVKRAFKEGEIAGREWSRTAFVVGLVTGVGPTLLLCLLVL